MRFDFELTQEVLAWMICGLPWVILLTYPAFLLAGVYRGIWRYAGFTDSFRFAGGAMIAGILVAIGSDFLPIRHSGSIAVLYALLLVNLLVATRMSFQVLRKPISRLATVTDRVLVVGAGEIGTVAAEFVFKDARAFSPARRIRRWGCVKQGKIVYGEEGKTTSTWSEHTTCRVTQGLMSALRDFGILQGAVHKRIAPTYVPVTAFAYVMFFLKEHQPSGAKLVEHPDWRLFFLPREGVERLLFEAHQRGLLEYHAAGSVTRLSFPAKTLEEYAHVLAERAH